MRRYLRTFGTLAWLAILLAPVALAQSKPLPFTFTGTLSGDQLLTPVETDATGTVIAVLTGNELVVTGTYQDLTSPVNEQIVGGANVRLASAGEEGRVVPLEADQATIGVGSLMALTTSGGRSGTFSGVFTLTDEQIEALADGLLYVQIHTIRNVGGEVRGQIGPNDTYDAYRDTSREYLAALEDPEVIHDATAADLVGIWRTVDGEDMWQNHEDGTWAYLDTLEEVGEVSTWEWQFNGDIAIWDLHGGQCDGRYVHREVLYQDGSRRFMTLEAGPCSSVGTSTDLVKIDEEGNRVNLRE